VLSYQQVTLKQVAYRLLQRYPNYPPVMQSASSICPNFLLLQLLEVSEVGPEKWNTMRGEKRRRAASLTWVWNQQAFFQQAETPNL